jgi:hypothetical protein
MVIVEKFVEWRLAGETEVLGENLPKDTDIHTSSGIWTHDPMILVFERAKTVHASDRAATVTGA